MKKLLLALFIAASVCLPALADVAKNDSGTPNSTVSSATSIDLTTFSVSSGSNLGLVAFLHTAGSVGSADCSWDSAGTPQAMTSAGTAVTNSTSRAQMFYLINPTTGNHTLTCTWTTSRNAKLGAIAFSGVNQSAMTSNYASGMNTDVNPTLAVTGESGGLTAVGTSSSGQNYTSTDTQTQIYRTTASPGAAASYSAVGAGANTHTFTIASSASWSIVGANIVAASAAVSGTNRLLMGFGN